MGLRLRLILLILIPALLVIGIAGLLTYETVRSTLIEAAQEETHHQAEDLAHEIGDELTADAQVPTLLASIDPNLYGSPDEYYAALHSVIPSLLTDSTLFNLGIFFQPGAIDGRQYALTWFLREPSGAIQELTPNLPGNPGYRPELPVYDYPTQEWFIVGRSVPGLVWTEPYFDAGGAEIAMVTATVPVKNGVDVIGVATTDVPLEKLRTFLTGSELSPNSYVILVSSQGRFIAHPRNPELELSETVQGAAERLDSDGLRQLEQELMAGIGGLLPIRDPWTGADAWAAYTDVPATGWSVIVITPVADVLGPVKELERTLLLTAAALAAVLTALVWLASTWFLRPIQALSGAVTGIAAGRREALSLNIRRRDELGRLAAGFEHMAGEVARSEASLEATVAARTCELQAALATQREQTQALQQALDEVRQQRAVIAALGTPVIPLRRDTLVVPVIGALDGERASQMMGTTLAAIEARRARIVIIDITGLPVVDTSAAGALVALAGAARLLGTRVLLVGISPEVAQSLVALGADLGNLTTLSTLEAAVKTVLTAEPQRTPRS